MKNCGVCKKDYEEKSAKQKFCSDSCKMKQMRSAKKGTSVEESEESKGDKMKLLREENEALTADVANLKKQNSELSFKVSELTRRLSEKQPAVQVRDFSSSAPKSNFVIDTIPKDIQKQIEELKSATKPSMIGKANFERWRANEIKKLQSLEKY